MDLSEFSKLLGEEIEEFESRPELSEVKRKAVEFIIDLEGKLTDLPSNHCTSRVFEKLVKNLSQPPKEVKKTKSCIFSADCSPKTRFSSLSTVGSDDSNGRLESRNLLRKDSLHVADFDNILHESKKIKVDFIEFSDQIRSMTISGFEELEKNQGEFSENCYIYGLILFKKFIGIYSKNGVGSGLIYSSLTEKGILVEKSQFLLTPLRLFKTCVLIGMKMLEEGTDLYLSDYCTYLGEAPIVIGDMEMLVCLEQLEFRFGDVCYEDILWEKEDIVSGIVEA